MITLTDAQVKEGPQMGKNALIIVDVQNDFVEGGALGVNGGMKAAENICKLVEAQAFDMLVTTQDWHINPGNHWSDTPDFIDTWPVHCAADTNGAAYFPLLADTLKGRTVERIFKGQYEAAYSGFEGTTFMGGTLQEVLDEDGITEVTIVGIATDHCVKETVTHALEAGYKVTVLTDCIAGVDPDRAIAAIAEFREAGVKVI